MKAMPTDAEDTTLEGMGYQPGEWPWDKIFLEQLQAETLNFRWHETQSSNVHSVS